MIGTTVGKYRIVGQLGRGAMGTVYRAVDETLGREVAVKVLNPEFTDSKFSQRFQTEAVTLARLNHPGIATLYELLRTGGDLLMVMEFVRGETLDKILERSGPLAPERAAHITDKILAALAYAHRAGVVHCDIKPANVMATQHGGVKVMDFGVARVRGAAQGTGDTFMAGTPAYVAPEMVLGQPVDSRADLYSVGVLFYRLLTGTLPFKADTATGMVQKQILEPHVPPSASREGLPPWCDTILQRALAKAPDDRFQTAEEFREALGQASGLARTELTQGLSDLAQLELTLPSVAAAGGTGTVALGTVRKAAGPMATQPIDATQAIERATIVVRREPYARPWSIIALGIALAALAADLAFRRTTPKPAAPPVANAAVVAPDPLQAPPAAPPADNTTVAAADAPSAESADAPPTTPPQPAVPVAPVPPASMRQPAIASRPAVATASNVAKPSPPPAKPAPPPATADVVEAAPAPAVASPPVDPAPPPAVTTVPFVFEAKALFQESGRSRLRDVRVVLADGKINVQANEDNHVLYAIPFNEIILISFSQGRDPLWNTPTGPTRVARADGGVLGVFRGTRYWVSLRTNRSHPSEQFFPLLVPSERVRRALTALEERTGRTAEVVAERKDDP